MSNQLIIPMMVHHSYIFLAHWLKDAYLVHLCSEAQKAGQTTAIFTNSVSETRRLSRLLDTLYIGVVSLEADLTPSARAAALDKLRRRECHAIVATDVAAALNPTIPMPKVDRIINFSLVGWKMKPETYNQRVSNVGCHDRHAITFVTQYCVGSKMGLEKALGAPLAEYAVDFDMVIPCHVQVHLATLRDPSLRDPDSY
ncbi:hypothetical protein GE09DRAFT_1153754 [Coniochaeta sp. 2T2.1]|nr:hypothetical protein GE09DRAFT_1153754 [Coniochaeta sp. 2T2.1]